MAFRKTETTMATRKAHDSDQFVNLNFRVYGRDAALVHEAAEKSGLTGSAYMRQVLLTYAAADLGRESPDLSPYAGDHVSLAAKRLGMTRDAFVELAINEHVQKVLGHLGAQDVVSRVSAELGRAVGLPTEEQTEVTQQPAKVTTYPPPKHGSGQYAAVGGVKRR